ncbi:MAG: RDD family protein, partial [Bacteroidota bacterium]|nr:RDD family protein [Bacteroidota bacterium]
MKIIEIKTTQNVVLQYELADLRDRILAFLIDSAAGIFGVGLLINLSSSIFSNTTRDVVMFLLIGVFIFYSLAFEVLNNGQSLGKMALRIQVIKATSGRPTLSDYA